MARIALIDAGEVAGIIVADLAFAQSRPEYGQCVDITDLPEVSIGWLYDGQGFTPPAAAPAQVPASVTMRQARLALLNNSLLDDVAPAIAALPEPDRTRAQIEWEYSNALERGNPFVATLGAALGLDAEALDDLFIEAAQL